MLRYLQGMLRHSPRQREPCAGKRNAGQEFVMVRISLGSIAVLGLILGACGPVAPPPVAPEPVFNKLGEGECPEGYTYIPGALFEGECDPDDEPRRPPRDDDDDDDDRRPRDPFAGIDPQ
jgi:hypothetical protein